MRIYRRESGCTVMLLLILATPVAADRREPGSIPIAPGPSVLVHSLSEEEIRYHGPRALMGDRQSGHCLAMHFAFVDFRNSDADYWIRVAAENGDRLSMQQLSLRLASNGNPRDAVRANYWKSRADSLANSTTDLPEGACRAVGPEETEKELAKAVCDGYWESQKPFNERDVQLFASDSVPEFARPVPGLLVKTFFRSDGPKIVPQSIRESNCHLERAFPEKIAAAFRSAAQESAVGLSEVPRREDIDDLIGSVNAHLATAVEGAGTDSGIGFFRLMTFVASDFGFVRRDIGKRPVLQRQIAGKGLCTTNEQLVYVMLAYIAHTGDSRYDPERFKSQLIDPECR